MPCKQRRTHLPAGWRRPCHSRQQCASTMCQPCTGPPRLSEMPPGCLIAWPATIHRAHQRGSTSEQAQHVPSPVPAKTPAQRVLPGRSRPPAGPQRGYITPSLTPPPLTGRGCVHRPVCLLYSYTVVTMPPRTQQAARLPKVACAFKYMLAGRFSQQAARVWGAKVFGELCAAVQALARSSRQTGTMGKKETCHTAWAVALPPPATAHRTGS